MNNQNEQVKPLSLEQRKNLYEARLASVRQEFANVQQRATELQAMERELMGALTVVNELLAPEQADANNKSAEPGSAANPKNAATEETKDEESEEIGVSRVMPYEERQIRIQPANR